MMLARVADSLYWIGRYVERAEHMCRLSDVMLNATLDRSEAATTVARIALSAVGDPDAAKAERPYDAALALALDREDGGSIYSSVARARENARQVRDQITTETWERLNLIYLRMNDPDVAASFAEGSQQFLHDTIADLHLFKGAGDATMSHGEGWSFLLLGVYLERAQLIGALLEVVFGEGRRRRPISDHFALTNVLRMGCALEPYLRVYTAEMQPRFILQFLTLDEDFPRSIRFCTDQIEQHLSAIIRHAGLAGRVGPDRLAGRLRARLQYADMTDLENEGASAFLKTVLDECSAIHRSLYDAFVAYPLEDRLPA
ncbi:alpha-E domain-containing protein [Phenylobacterium sp.]|uniref:alpha-E domain-containing protein n=1 Tax=Phenylobacterium sp. TaxID=1871053 RepID=UPI0025FD7BB6|nr:alpha-E domain-containing protein [Phenylobacterium sp.]MBX3482317.1 alpha-E domain-containing protein [Phenylobacterium sp.]MCW5759327.1 alpha-E domain-containing protein [Phenylobacterium sp.]